MRLQRAFALGIYNLDVLRELEEGSGKVVDLSRRYKSIILTKGGKDALLDAPALPLALYI